MQLLLAISAIGLSTVLSACKGGGPPPEFPAAAKVGVATTQNWQQTYITTGAVEANEKVDMNTEVAGTIVHLHFTEGQPIQKGQVLVLLKADKYIAQVNSAFDQMDVQSAETERLKSLVASALSKKSLAESEFAKFKKLHQQELISSLELDQKRSTLDAAVADYNATLSQYQSATAQETKAHADYRYSQAVARESTIRAPFTGIVGQKYVATGDYILPGEKIVTVVDSSKLRITFAVPERYLGYIKTGLPVLVYTEARPDQKFNATVTFVDPVVDPNSRTLVIKAEISDPERALKHGQSAVAKLVLETIPEAVVVPFADLVNDDNKAHLQAITTGSRDNGLVHVTDGIKKGDRFVQSGLQKVYDGASINEVKDDTALKEDN